MAEIVASEQIIHKVVVQRVDFDLDASDLATIHGQPGRFSEAGGLPGVLSALRTRAKMGLSTADLSGEAIKARQRCFGVNVFPRPVQRTFFWHFVNVWKDPVLILLTVSGLFSLIVGTVQHPSYGFAEGASIIGTVFIIAAVGGGQNLQQEVAFRKLEDTGREDRCRVLRDGSVQPLPMSLVVVGDIVEVTAGDAVPADGIVVSSENGACDEAKMTGESVELPKTPRKPFVLAGTEVTRGSFRFVVTAVGVNTAYGRIMSALATSVVPTPLQQRLNRFTTLVSLIGGAVCALLFVFLLIVFTVEAVRDDWSAGEALAELVSIFILCITLLVVAIPEGLPLAITLSLMFAISRMTKDKNLVRVLSACETMGNATAICSDKTGTLTQNRMTVVQGWLAGVWYDDIAILPKLSEPLAECLTVGAGLNSKATFEAPTADSVGKQPVWHGSQTEIALMQWLLASGLNVAAVRDTCIILQHDAFDAIKKFSSVVVQVRRTSDGALPQARKFVKGASEQIYARATHVMDATGLVIELDDQRRSEVVQSIDRMAASGLRTIGIAFHDQTASLISGDDNAVDAVLNLTNDRIPQEPKPADDPFVLFAVVGIKDPLRRESRAAVRACQRAGVIVRMVTGDHPSTARHIARECGILTDDSHLVLTGEEFRALMAGSPAEAERVLPSLRVLARSLPDDKKTLVKWLQAHHHTVAVTGDGTNDAPALKEADIGIAMHAGTSVAKQAAQIIIMDDNFASIVKSLMWGRCVYDNVRKFVQFQLTIITVAILLSLIGAFSFYTRPLTAVQLLWMNLIMDTFCALSLCTDTPTTRLLQRKPYVKSAHVISPLMLRNIVCHTVFQLTALLLVLYLGARIWDLPEKSEHHYTLVFNTYVFLQLFNEVNMRQVTSRDANVFAGLTTNYSFWASKGICCALQFLMVEYFGAFGGTHALDWQQWLLCVGIGSLELMFGFVVRLIPVDDESGLVVSPPPGAFTGANLEQSDDATMSQSGDSNMAVRSETVPVIAARKVSLFLEMETVA